jgi:hypothetical protein
MGLSLVLLGTSSCEHIGNLGKHVPNALGFWVARILVAVAKEMVSHAGH